MTDQVHSLQLKIDAAAAEAGSKRFTAALSAVKKAVSDLDRAADGTFAKLANHRPEFDVTPLRTATSEANRLSNALTGASSASDRAATTIQRTALASASAVRMAEQATQRLALRMGDLGDNQGVASLNSALAQMKASLVNATSTLDVRRAKSQFDDLRSGLLQATVAAEYAQGEQAQLARELEQTGRAAQQQAEALSRLRAAHDPLFAASQRYSTALSEIDSLVAANMVSEAQASSMRERAAATYLAMGSAADTFAGQARNGAMAAQQVGFQLNDIGVMLAGGMSPLSIAVTQGTQLAQTFQGLRGSTSILSTLAGGFAAMVSPVSLVTIGVIALGAALVQWMTSGSTSTKDFATALGDADSAISSIRQATDTLAGATLGSLAEGYGRVNAQLQTHLQKLQEIARIEAARVTTDAFAAVGSEYLGGWLTTDVDDMRIAFGTTNDQARALLAMLDKIKSARTFEDQFAAVQKMRAEVESVTGGLKNSEGGARAFLIQLIKAEDAGIRLKAATDGTGAAAGNASGAASGLAFTIGTAADEAARLLANLNSVPSALATMGKSVEGQIASIRAQNRALNLELSEGLSSAAANRRVQLETMITTAGERGQRITPDAIAAEWVKINELDAAAKEQERLRKQITEQNRPARSAGAGGKRVEELGDESRQLSKLSKQMNDRIFAIERENAALNLLAQGQARTKEGAELMAMALETNGGKLDAATAAAIRNYEANVLLNQQLQRDAKNPFQDYIDGLPSAIEAAKQLKADLAQVMEGGLTDLFMGEFDAKKIVDSVRRSLAQMLAQRTMKMVFGNLFDTSGIAQASTAGAQQMNRAIVTGSQQGAQMFAAAISGAAVPTGGMGGGFGGGFGLLGGLFSLFGLAEGGYSDGPGMSTHMVSPAVFRHAPHYAQGTANTSGIPAVLHPNEAVIPLTKGRKVPVDMKQPDSAKEPGGDVLQTININTTVTVQGGDTSEETALAAARAVRDTIKVTVRQELADAMRYGGTANPRGR